MRATNSTPKQFAQTVCRELRRVKTVCPRLEILTNLFETLFFASLRTEESEPIKVHIVYLDPDNPDPDPPPRIRNDRWKCVKLHRRIPVSVSNIVKIAKASDPRSSSFAVYHNARGKLFIWGLVDQGTGYYNFVNYNVESAYAHPGLFQASIAGPAHLVAYIESDKIAELNIDTLITNAQDVLSEGPVFENLSRGVKIYLREIRNLIDKDLQGSLKQWSNMLMFYWITSICRVLLRIQNFRHGGAILITPDDSFNGLNVKYQLNYTRLSEALKKHAVLKIQRAYTGMTIINHHLQQQHSSLPTELYRAQRLCEENLLDNQSELDGTVWFISLLSRVDGLILLTPNLIVQGFGVEITYSDEPKEIYKASNTKATRTQKIDYNHYGTRHRSMMRYCSQIPGSVGFIVSQDGIVRAVTRVKKKLIMWEDIKLHLSDFPYSKDKADHAKKQT